MSEEPKKYTIASFDDPTEACRRALLRYYNSQTMTHGGYIIALTIGILTLISRWKEFAGSNITWIIFFSIVDLLLAFGVYIFGRTLFWGYLAYRIMNAKLDEKDVSEQTIMFQLHEETERQVYRRSRFAGHFCRLRLDIIIAVLLILWLLSFQLSLFSGSMKLW